MEPHVAPALCALGVAMAAFLLAPRSEPPPIAPVPAPIPAPPPPLDEGPRVVLRTLEPDPRGPVFAVFDDGTALSHWPGQTTVGPLAPEHRDALAALRAQTAPFSFPAQRTGCLQHGGLELLGEGSDASYVQHEAARKLMGAIDIDLRRKRRLLDASLVVATTLIRARPSVSVTIRIDEVLHAAPDQPTPEPGAVLTLPEHLLELSWGTGHEDARVWTITGGDTSRWWPQPDLDVDRAKRDLAWVAAQPPAPEREALLRRAREGVPVETASR